jgi:hypothetical protein
MYRTSLSLILITASTLAGAQICDVTITHQINGNQVQYFGTCPDNPTQWSWFFNGGTPLTSNQQNPVVTYSGTGQFICALSVSGGPNGCSAALSQDVDTVVIISTALPDLSRDPFRITSFTAERIEVENLEAQRVTMTLTDLAGRSVRTIYEGVLPAGRTILPLHTTDMRAGIYFLSLATPDGVTTRKFMVE